MNTMWIIYALASACFAGVVSILAKVGLKDTDSDLATALRTGVVAIFAWLMVLIAGSAGNIRIIDSRSMVFIILSGIATGTSWLFYFRALQMGNVSKVVPVEKTSTLLTMLLSFWLLGERFTWIKGAAMVLIGAGTYLMLERKTTRSASVKSPAWLIYACLSAVFASLTAILGKIGIEGVESNLGTAMRTIVVLLIAWIIVFSRGKQKQIKTIHARNWLFILLSGVATGLSWMCFYRALKEGPASVVVPIDKLSILFTVMLGRFFLRETLGKKEICGLVCIVAGTLSLLL